MSGAVRSELLKLRTSRSTIALLVAGVVYAVLNGIATTHLAGREGNAPLGTVSNIANVLRAGNVATWLILLVGLLSMTGEHRHHTITSTYLATPRRGSVIRAKMAVVAVLGLAYAVVTMAAGVGTALPELLDAPGRVDVVDTHLARGVGGLLVVTVLYGITGVAVGGLVRNQTAAVTGALAWLVAGEPIVGSIAGWHVARWFPGQAAAAAAGTSSETLLPMASGAALFAAYAIVATVVATWTAVARDVT